MDSSTTHGQNWVRLELLEVQPINVEKASPVDCNSYEAQLGHGLMHVKRVDKGQHKNQLNHIILALELWAIVL